MPDAAIITTLRDKYGELLEDLDERGRRRWAAVEARALGRGGIAAVAAATGLSDRTIRTGLKELDDPAPVPGHRQRKRGGGRKPHATTRPCGAMWFSASRSCDPPTLSKNTSMPSGQSTSRHRERFSER